MDYFSVNYQGLESIRQQEEKIYQILDGICEELFLIKSNVDVQPTLWGHGYGGKLWEAYSRTVTISSHVNRMRTGLGKVSDKYMEYGQKVLAELKEAGIRAEIDTKAEKIGYKIREARLQKIPYMLVVGAKEEEDGVVSVRSRFKGDEGQKGLDAFISDIKEEIKNRENRKVEVEEQK